MKKRGKIIFRFILLFFLTLVVGLYFIYKAKLDSIPFTLKEGDISCETTDECLDKVRSFTNNELNKEIQTKKRELRRATSILRSFAIIPIEYEVEFENFSYLKAWITGTEQEEKVMNISVDCSIGSLYKKLYYSDRITVFQNLEIDNLQEEIFDHFDGCALSPDSIEIKGVKGWIFPPGEFFKVSFERDFQFIFHLKWTSIFLIIFQSFVIILLTLPILRQGGLFMKEGIKYFLNK